MAIEVHNAYGLAVKRRREAAGLTQYQLADRAGLERTDISKFERGQVRVPGIEKQEKVAKALGVKPEVLLTEMERLKKQPPKSALPVTRGRPRLDRELPMDEVEGRLLRLLPRLKPEVRLHILKEVELFLKIDETDDV
jgi:transcriptional regulator with XRE-family HTH domain